MAHDSAPNMAGIYIHIPFCRQICRYCDFYRSGSLSDKQAVLEAISRELTARREEVQGTVETLYFGGGTPSLCSVEEIGGLVGQVSALWGVSKFREVTLEANPDDLTPEYLKGLRATGVNRLSIGIQSFCDAHLERMNRRHTAREAVAAVRAAQEVGFENLTIDLIYGLPWMTPQEWEYNLEQALALGVQVRRCAAQVTSITRFRTLPDPGSARSTTRTTGRGNPTWAWVPRLIRMTGCAAAGGTCRAIGPIWRASRVARSG